MTNLQIVKKLTDIYIGVLDKGCPQLVENLRDALIDAQTFLLDTDTKRQYEEWHRKKYPFDW